VTFRQASRIFLQLIPGSDLRFRLQARSQDQLAPKIVKAGFHLTVDGFPRSANTWVYYQLQLAFPDCQIAHHVHSWQQFMFSRLLKIPSVLILRHPDDAIQSLYTKKGGSLFLNYIDYLITNGLAQFFADEVRFFDNLVTDGGMDNFLHDTATILGISATPFDPSAVQHLMETRTNHKNVETPNLDTSKMGVVTQWARRAANHLYVHLLNRAQK